MNGTTPPETKVLVVDDDPKILAVLQRYLDSHGYRVLTANEGSTALGIAVETRPDIVISDVEIPDMDGFKLCRLLRADERTANVPVILMSGRRGNERDRRARARRRRLRAQAVHFPDASGPSPQRPSALPSA